MLVGLNVKCPFFLSDFNNTSIFDRFSKNIQTSNSVKLHLVEAKLLHAGVRTDIHEVFCNFVKVPKKSNNGGYSGHWNKSEGIMVMFTNEEIS
jgi:hypothetical protein